MRLKAEGLEALQIDTPSWPMWSSVLAGRVARMAEGSGGRFAAMDIDDALFDGRMHAWVALTAEGEIVESIRALLVTEIIGYPRMKALRLVGLVGEDLRTWLPLWSQVERWARGQNCKRLEALHPEPYSKLLGRLGWSAWHVLSEKPL